MAPTKRQKILRKFRELVEKSLNKKYYYNELDLTDYISEDTKKEINRLLKVRHDRLNIKNNTNIKYTNIEKYIISSSDIRHILDRHSEFNEKNPNQKGFTISDLDKIIDVILYPKKIYENTTNEIGLGINLSKTINDLEVVTIAINMRNNDINFHTARQKRQLKGLDNNVSAYISDITIENINHVNGIDEENYIINDNRKNYGDYFEYYQVKIRGSKKDLDECISLLKKEKAKLSKPSDYYVIEEKFNKKLYKRYETFFNIAYESLSINDCEKILDYYYKNSENNFANSKQNNTFANNKNSKILSAEIRYLLKDLNSYKFQKVFEKLFSLVSTENKIDNPTIQKNVKEFIDNKSITLRELKEIYEHCLYVKAKQLIDFDKPIEDNYDVLYRLYCNQANINLRTATSVMLQQYSTPIFISYLCGTFVLESLSLNQKKYIFEATAGNGFLTCAFPEKSVIVNEIDDVRSINLKTSDYAQQFNLDATKPFDKSIFLGQITGVVINPPFGSLDKSQYKDFDGFTCKKLEHLITINSLNVMVDDGAAAIIVGGNTIADKNGFIKEARDREFLCYLYRNYNVVDIINIDGKKMYSRQGTGYDIKIILIKGRKRNLDNYPDTSKETLEQVKDEKTLLKRILDNIEKN